LIAALYVAAGGIYYGLPDVDPWDEARDARLYDGPWPVVAHPPCRTWSILSLCRPEIPRGQDGGCFAAALAAVRQFGGVLEHPRHTRAWQAFALPQPPRYGWARSLLDDGWACEVDQARYGHRANKPTWLYYVGDAEPPPMRWDRGEGRISIHNSHHGDGTDRSGTPPEFRDTLLAIARLAPLPKSKGTR
jgi:hypothetical protein